MQPKKIFIVDDDSFLLDMYALKFSQSGFDVSTALGAVAAIEKLHTDKVYQPDLILLDIVMPVMDGFEFMAKMIEENLVPTAMRIVLSNRGQDSDIKKAEELGAVGYIVKASTTPAEVVQQVTAIIAKKQK
jgi:CheY-like chemotaxis protein